MTARRTNETWQEALDRDPDPAAVADLRALLLRGLRGALGGRSDVRESDLEDFTQDALLKILDSLDTFRGESRFTTWAQKIAVRVALTELRRKRWRDWSLERMLEGDDGADRAGMMSVLVVDSGAGPEQQVVQRALIDVVGKTINEKLTEKQRLALVAVNVHGVPLDELSRHLDTNRNALYKLIHDARKRLKRELIDAGLAPDEILGAFE